MSTRQAVPALVGTQEACRILGVTSSNLDRLRGLPPALQERGIEGFEVGVTRLWPRQEIEELAAARASRKAARHAN